jgi:hypothetical protein
VLVLHAHRRESRWSTSRAQAASPSRTTATPTTTADEDGEYVGQTRIGTRHLSPGETDADESEFTSYGRFEDKHELSDIASVKVTHVERTAPAT